MTSDARLPTFGSLNVLIIPDKFKRTLAAHDVAVALAKGWHAARRHDRLELAPMTDGGDGFGETFGGLLRARARKVTVVDAAHRNCSAEWWYSPGHRTAIIESARVIGLAMLPQGQFHPFELDTFGLGMMIRRAAAAGAARCLVGLGGSATNDAGFGLARALGWEFLDASGRIIDTWPRLTELRHLRAPRRRRWFRELLVAVDVANPLVGPRGASRVYGPQKGLHRKDFALAEHALGKLARVVADQFPYDYAQVPGAGAAGGLGFGFQAFLGARLLPGFQLFARQTGLDKRLARADLVITGEGGLDRSTLMGKGVGEIARRCQELGIPCIGVGGTISAGDRLNSAFSLVRALTEVTSLEKAKARPAFWLERVGHELARCWGGVEIRRLAH